MIPARRVFEFAKADGLIERSPFDGIKNAKVQREDPDPSWGDEQVQRRVFDAALKRCGIRHRPAYQTRHTFATLCLMSGANPAWVARQLGHTTPKMLFEVYAKWIDGADKGVERGRVETYISAPRIRKA